MTSKQALPLRIHALRRLNPMIACLLKSPAHRLASRRLFVLQYRGQKSGKAYTIPLVYVTHAGDTYCVTRDTLWWKSAISAPSVTIWLRGSRLNARAERLSSTSACAREVFEKFLRENPGTATLLYNVRMHAQGMPDASDVTRELDNSKLIRLSTLPVAGAS